MHKKKMVSCLSAALLLLAQAPAYSAGLGKLTVSSALGQPLNAEIEVLAADPTELASLQARMANTEAYRTANIEMTSALSGLKFVLDKKPGGRSVLKVTSSKPVNDPFVDMLIELSWASGQMVREYTMLLDPPGMNLATQNNRSVTIAPATTTSAAIVEKPVSSESVSSSTTKTNNTNVAKPATVRPVPKAAATRPSDPTPAPVAKAEIDNAAGNVIASPTQVKIKRGATLSSVAQAVKPEGVKLEQMLVGLYRKNPAAFDGNMNQMKAGKVLIVPSKEDIAAISQVDAVREIKLQANDWHSYRQKLAGEVAAAPAAEVKTQSSSGKVTPKIEDKAAPVKAGQDVLKLSKGEAPAADNKAANAAKSAKPTAAEQKQAAQDEAVAKQKALKEANDRAAALEKNIKDMQRLVELKNESLANLQKKEAAKPAVAPLPPVVAPEVKPVPEVKPEPAKVAPVVIPAPVVAPKTPDVKPAPPVAQEPAWYEEINPLYAAGGAIGALVLALFGFMAKSRGRRANLSKFENSIMTNIEAKPNTVYGTQGGASVNTNNTSFLTDFSQSGLGNLDTHDVDPIAEAEVYMAYGRDAQAEEILKEAMVKDPARHEIKLKLLEIYAGRKNLPAFESVATELYSALAGENSPVWEKAAEFGRGLDPNNPLYGGVASTTPAVATIAAPVAVAAIVAASVASAEPDVYPEMEAAAEEGVLDLSAEEGVLDLSGTLDFDSDLLNMDSAITHSGEDTAPAATHGMLDMSEFELPAAITDELDGRADALDFDMPVTAADEDLTPVAEPVVVGSKVEEVTVDDDNTLSFDFDLGEHAEPEIVMGTPSTVTENDVSLDFSGISFDFDTPVDQPVASIDAGEEHAQAVVEPELSEVEQEIKTKLDLAQVYLEMGDNENAREILHEVVLEGNAQQQEHAYVLLQQAS